MIWMTNMKYVYFTQKLKQNWDDAGLTVTSISTEPEKKQTAPPTVFVSYSHKDKKEKDDLLIQLKVIKGAGLIDHWSDDRIGAGAEWEQEIHQAIAQARVAILLISANFLASDFINDIEVPALLERHEREELTIFPVIARDCAWERVEKPSLMEPVSITIAPANPDRFDVIVRL